jgi:hypothetical protein
MPSKSRVSDVVGAGEEDYAINVWFEELRNQAWFAPQLVEALTGTPAIGTRKPCSTLRMWSMRPPATSGFLGLRREDPLHPDLLRPDRILHAVGPDSWSHVDLAARPVVGPMNRT